MKKYIPILFVITFLSSCIGGSVATQYRKEGVSLIHRGFFKYTKKDPSLHKTIVIKNLVIHIVGDKKHFLIKKYKDPEVKGYRPNVIGYALSYKGINEVYVRGTTKDGKIIINLQNLGHEIGHILRMNNSLVLDPHDFDDWGV